MTVLVTLKEVTYWQVKLEDEDAEQFLEELKERNVPLLTDDGAVYDDDGAIGEDLHAWMGDDFEPITSWGIDWHVTNVEVEKSENERSG
jgi:hypothetical protein